MSTKGCLTVALLLGTFSLSACTSGNSGDLNAGGSSGSDFSRVRFYPSLSAISADSMAIVEGVVVSQRVEADITPDLDFTVSTIRTEGVVKSDKALRPGQVVEVRQAGSAKQLGPSQLLGVGGRYLLFLTPSGLAGPLASQYYITGVDAGVYLMRVGDKISPNMQVSQFHRNDGDVLPNSPTLADIASSVAP